VTDGIESAIRRAKATAGEKDVTVIGAASTAQQCIKAGAPDELHIDIMPVFLGGGLRPFGELQIEAALERTRVVELPGGRTHLEFRFVK
jgi:dihydrofolate reductase